MRRLKVGRGLIELVSGDITLQSTDAIVNAANRTLRGGGGVDGAIHRAGGPDILEECTRKYPNGIDTGQAVVTGGGNLPARFVIHAVGPVWRGGKKGEAERLAVAYRESLERAKETQIRHIAFPSISTGAYGYPLNPASRIALKTCADTLVNDSGTVTMIRFVLFNEETVAAYEEAMEELSTELSRK